MIHINNIIQLKLDNPDTSIYDIILEYCKENEEDFDIDELISQLRTHKGFKEYVKRDMHAFGFCKNVFEPSDFHNLF